MFGQGDNAEERAAIVDQTGSILDSVMGDASSLQRKLGAADTAMVSDYLESVREIERRVQMMKSQDLSNVEIPNAPVGIPTSFEDHLKIMFDLVALSYQINLTHVASMMMEKEVSMRTYTNIGVADAFHPLSHHGDDPEKWADWQKYKLSIPAFSIISSKNWTPCQKATAQYSTIQLFYLVRT